ncbi:hypothetical protein ACO0M4_08910 [Streptomyces sp. RGM 3693]|uniref:hypothetical protein n=1 Tax=Streptomyces sp. RGM 3693 TaxID=3413284 RepID=UPI003D26FB6A
MTPLRLSTRSGRATSADCTLLSARHTEEAVATVSAALLAHGAPADCAPLARQLPPGHPVRGT